MSENKEQDLTYEAYHIAAKLRNFIKDANEAGFDVVIEENSVDIESEDSPAIMSIYFDFNLKERR